MKIFIIFSMFFMVHADLLDLYVQHMDETIGSYFPKSHARDVSFKLRSKKSVQDTLDFGPIVRKQRIDVDDNWWNLKKRTIIPIVKPDGLSFPNAIEGDNDARDYEFLEDNRPTEEEEEEDDFNEKKPIEDEASAEVLEDIDRPMTINNVKKHPKQLFNSYDPIWQDKNSSDSPGSKTVRLRRGVKEVNFTRKEVMDDDGDIILEWDPSDDEIVTFQVIAKTRGYIGIAFTDRDHAKSADILVIWVDDRTGVPNLLDAHGDLEPNAPSINDISQDVKVVGGFQNASHTSVTFSRRWQTCDSNDHHLTEDNVRILWSMHKADPESNTPVWHGEKRGGRSLRLKDPAARKPPLASTHTRPWDIKLNQFAVDDKQDTIYWCKIFKAPALTKKHHLIGYEPLVEKENADLVHHMILYECASTAPILGQHARISGAHCYSPTMPKVWDSCIQPVVAWARGSRGEWLPEHVGIPVAEHQEGSYYMLEVHYNNPGLKNANDSSGVRLYLTPELRAQEAGVFITGVAVSPLHFIPPQQKEYAIAGYCSDRCTDSLFPEEGVNVVSVMLHSHLAGRRMSLKHIRGSEELPNIVRENHYDFDYQQSHTLAEEVTILPGDELVTDCVYATQDRYKPTLGGYSATQEMCLAFVIYYPRTQLAGCYSMTPAKDLFKTLGVSNFKGISLDNADKLFTTTGIDAVTLPTTVQQQLPVYPATRASEDVDDEVIKEAESVIKAINKIPEEENEDSLFARLVIEDPEEFRGRTVAEHMLALPWSESLLTKSIENSLYYGRHMAFCRKSNDKLAFPPEIQLYPNFTKLPEKNATLCHEKPSSSSTILISNLLILLSIAILSICCIC